MVLDGSSLDPPKDTDTWDSPDLESRYASVFPLKINRQYLHRPSPLLLYAGFAGPWNWERTVMLRISSQLEMVRGLLRRDPTQPELDSMVEHTSREVNTRRLGLPLGLTAGSAHALYTLRKQLHIPPTTALVEGLQAAWRQAPAADRRQALVQSGLRLGAWTVFAVGNFAALASYRFTVALSTDPRMADFRDAIRRYAEARMQKLDGYREKTRQRRDDLDATRHTTASAEEPGEVTYGQDQTGVVSDAVYDSRRWQTPTTTSADNSFYSSSSSSSSQDFFDDASPTAPDFRSVASRTSPNENAWERVRRENSSHGPSSPSSWGRQRTETSAAAPNSSSAGSEFSSYIGDEQSGRREKEAAQREFDRMIDAERQVSNDGGEDDKGWRRW